MQGGMGCSKTGALLHLTGGRGERGWRMAVWCVNTKMSDNRKEASFGCIVITVKTQRQNVVFATVSFNVEQYDFTNKSGHQSFIKML